MIKGKDTEIRKGRRGGEKNSTKIWYIQERMTKNPMKYKASQFGNENSFQLLAGVAKQKEEFHCHEETATKKLLDHLQLLIYSRLHCANHTVRVEGENIHDRSARKTS